MRVFVLVSATALIALSGCSAANESDPRLGVAEALSETYTKVQIENCAHSIMLAKVLMKAKRGGAHADVELLPFRDIVPLAYKIEVGEVLSLEKIAERSELSGVFDGNKVLAGDGEPEKEVWGKFQDCDSFINYIVNSTEFGA